MTSRDSYWMGLALQLARQGQGNVEPNPMVGCVVVQNGELVGSGYHQRFGGPHAEVDAIQKCAPHRLSDSTIYVTLEPCSHFGKTPPCVDLLLKVRPARVVIAMVDPFSEVAGKGIQALRSASIAVEVGVCEDEARRLNAPYLKLIDTGKPWVIAKWAMSLDGAIATSTGDSKWISNEYSRRIVHVLRARMDAILIGVGTALSDDPVLTARIEHQGTIPRTATRIVVDRGCRLPISSQLIKTCRQVPLLIATLDCKENLEAIRAYEKAGSEVWALPTDQADLVLSRLFIELGRRRFTNVLIEGGHRILGSAFDEGLIDEVHCFVAPILIGGEHAARPLGGKGHELIKQACKLNRLRTECLEEDVYVQGRLR